MVFSGYVPSSGIAGSYDSFIHSLLRKLHTILHSGCISLHSGSSVVYNILLKASRGVLFLPPSDVYVRSFVYLFYILIKLYYIKALSNQASPLTLD